MGIINTSPLATKFDRKDRISRNSGLLFNAASTQYLQSKTNLVVNTDDTMLVSFYINLIDVVSDYLFEYDLYGALIDSNGFLFIWTKDTVSQIGFTTVDLTGSIGRTAHIAIAFDELNDHVRIYLNGFLVFTKDLSAGNDVIVNGNDVVEIGRWQGTAPTGYSNNVISEFMISEYNQSDITESEQVNYMFREGIPSAGLHEFIVAHYPINEKYAFKTDSTFNTNHPNFSIGDNVFFDVVESYNYAKGTPVSAKHSEPINFADADLGTGGDVRTITDIIGFYDKAVLDWFDTPGAALAEDNIEKISGIPPITHYLDWTAANTIDIPLAAIDAIGTDLFTIISQFEIDTFAGNERLFELIYETSATIIYQWIQNSTHDGLSQIEDLPDFNRLGSTDGGDQKPFVQMTMNVLADRKLNMFLNNRSANLFSENGITDFDITGTTTAVIKGKVLKWIRFTIYKGLITRKEHLNIFTNTLANPIQKDTYLDYLFASPSFSEDGSNVKIADLSGNGHDGNVNGFVGATTALQLADLLTNLHPLSDLR